MKTIKNLKLFAILALFGAVLTACVQDDDYNTPDAGIEEPNVTVNYTLGELKQLLVASEGAPVKVGEGVSEPMYLEAYIVSNDKEGNIYKQVYVQDKPENPTHAIMISTEATGMFAIYGKGRKIYIRIDGLTVAMNKGMPIIGGTPDSNYGATRISENKFYEHVLPSTTIAEIVPLTLTLSEAKNDTYLGMYAEIANAQFANPNQNYTTNNENTSVSVEDCEGANVELRNSSFADFADNPLPNGNGTIKAIIAKYGDNYQFFINTDKDVDFAGARCGAGEVGVFDAPFSEDFESLTDYDNVSLDGWSNILVDGDRVWQAREHGDNMYAQLSAYNASGVVNAWLVTPGINIATVNNPVLSFETADGHNNGDALTVKISTNFDGDINAATWVDINPTLATGTAQGYGDFVFSGEIDLSAYVGENVFVAFIYEGDANGVTSTFQVDNVYIGEAGEQGNGGDNGGGENPGGDVTIISAPLTEDFTGLTDYDNVSLTGWTNVKTTGDRVWQSREFDGNMYAQLSAYNAGGDVEGWLVTPGVDLTGITAPYLQFDSKDGHNNGDVLTVKVSTDFSGDVTTATWTDLNPVIATGTAQGYAPNFTDSGQVDLSAYAGENVFVAFVYVGSANGVTTTIQIDNIFIGE